MPAAGPRHLLILARATRSKFESEESPPLALPEPPSAGPAGGASWVNLISPSPFRSAASDSAAAATRAPGGALFPPDLSSGPGGSDRAAASGRGQTGFLPFPS